MLQMIRYFLIVNLFLVSIFASSNIFVKKGWNLVSTSTNVTNLDSIVKEINSIWKFSKNQWYAKSSIKNTNAILKAFKIPEIKSLKAGNGFWIYSNKDINLSLEGSEEFIPKVAIDKGWNLLGLTKNSPTSIFDNSCVSYLWEYDNNSKKWKLYRSDKISNYYGYEKFTDIKIGTGFWAYGKNNCNISIEDVKKYSPPNQPSIEDNATTQSEDENRYNYNDRGLFIYAKSMLFSSYKLNPIDDKSFNNLNEEEKYKIADKLLASLYFGMPYTKLKKLIDSKNFISTIKSLIQKNSNNMSEVENKLNDNGKDDSHIFYFYSWPHEVPKILARFYLMKDLDKNYINHWIAYVLTYSIMFSPAYELSTSHSPNIERVYNKLVRYLEYGFSARYITYLHMMSEDNWRRFRSPEDNGREMMEIFLFDYNDSHVPIAAQALKNWKLNSDSDTLVIGLDENSKPLKLFGTTVVNGVDFYRELVKSKDFMPGVTRRLVDIYFQDFTPDKKDEIVKEIVSSNPKTWRDILLQIVFSKEYLFDSNKPKSAEELFYSLEKKIYFRHRRGFFSQFANALVDMNQAPMKYKLGRYNQVPLDTLSFLSYHKFIREKVLISNLTSWRGGWDPEKFIPNSIFDGVDKSDYVAMLKRLVNYLFLSTISRKATQDEFNLFKNYLLNKDGSYKSKFNLMQQGGDVLNGRIRASVIILDYISRLSETYRFSKVAK